MPYLIKECIECKSNNKMFNTHIPPNNDGCMCKYSKHKQLFITCDNCVDFEKAETTKIQISEIDKQSQQEEIERQTQKEEDEIERQTQKEKDEIERQQIFLKQKQQREIYLKRQEEEILFLKNKKENELLEQLMECNMTNLKTLAKNKNLKCVSSYKKSELIALLIPKVTNDDFPITENTNLRKCVNRKLPDESIIIFHNHYYKIEKSTDDKKYKLMCIEFDTFEENKRFTTKQRGIDTFDLTIRIFDIEIIPIVKNIQDKIIKFNKFKKSYNEQISYLNYLSIKSLNKIVYESLKWSDILQFINLNCNIKDDNLYDILRAMKSTGNADLQIMNLLINPFNFITEETQYISYLTADKICIELKINIDFGLKCQKWAFWHIINTYKSFYVEAERFHSDFNKWCYASNHRYNKYVQILNSVIRYVNFNNCLYITSQYLYNYEKTFTGRFIDLCMTKPTDYDENDIIKYMSEFEKSNYKLDDRQQEAVIKSLTHNVSVITGYPGTGKTTIVECILFIIHKLNNRPINCDTQNNIYYTNKYVSVLSPTGIAYVNIKDKCTRKCDELLLFNPNISGTCYKRLHYTFPTILRHINKNKHADDYEEDDYEEDDYDKDETLIPKYIILDEASMVDIFLFKNLIDCCSLFNCQLIIIGDPNQLPSIGPGEVLNSIININLDYEICNVIKLTTIKRQDEGVLLENIKKMAEESITISDFTDDSMKFIDINLFLNSNNKIDEIKLTHFINDNNLNRENSKFLSYFNGENPQSQSHFSNVVILNKLLQKNFNNHGDSLESPHNNFGLIKHTFKTGDIIIRTLNDNSSNKYRANGEQAQIVSPYDKQNEKIEIKYGDEDENEYIRLSVLNNEFILGYALTVHKSQGSQYTNTIIFIEGEFVWNKQALYTAISRTIEKCFIIGNASDLIKIQQKNSSKISYFLSKKHSKKHIKRFYDTI
jgi:energy-coupling factor transporter ATP-binding protein EcfA2